MEPFETPLTGRPIHLTYFAPSGMYLGEARYRTLRLDPIDIYAEVVQMRDSERLPSPGSNAEFAFILVDGIGVAPRLIWPLAPEGKVARPLVPATLPLPPTPSLSPTATGLLATLALCLLYLFIRWGLLCP